MSQNKAAKRNNKSSGIVRISPNIWFVHPIRLWSLCSIRVDAKVLQCIRSHVLATFYTIWWFSNPKCRLFRRHRPMPSSSCRVKRPNCTHNRTPCGRWMSSFGSFWSGLAPKICKFYYPDSGMPAICHLVIGLRLASNASSGRQYISHRPECPIPKFAYSYHRMW